MYPKIEITEQINIPTYGLVFLAGLFLAVILCRQTAKKADIEKPEIINVAVYTAIGILIGSKLLFFIVKLPGFISNFDAVRIAFSKNWKDTLIYLLNYLFGGFVFYGGLMGAIFGLWFYCKIYKMNFINFIDATTAYIPLVHGVGRIGCFLAGCCYGIEYHGFLSVNFPANPYDPQLSKVPRFPVQLAEAGLNFVMFSILLTLFCKNKLRGGKLLGVYAIYYSLARFLLEFFRADTDRGGIGFLSTSQIISIVFLPIGIFLLLRKTDKTKSGSEADCEFTQNNNTK